MSEQLKSLLEQQHAFPGRYTFRVIGHSNEGSTGNSAEANHGSLKQLFAEHGVLDFHVETQASSAGKYTAYRIHAFLQTSDDVAKLNGAFQALPWVKIVM